MKNKTLEINDKICDGKTVKLITSCRCFTLKVYKESGGIIVFQLLEMAHYVNRVKHVLEVIGVININVTMTSHLVYVSHKKSTRSSKGTTHVGF